jgi:hypothetical protein
LAYRLYRQVSASACTCRVRLQTLCLCPEIVVLRTLLVQTLRQLAGRVPVAVAAAPAEYTASQQSAAADGTSYTCGVAIPTFTEHFHCPVSRTSSTCLSKVTNCTYASRDHVARLMHSSLLVRQSGRAEQINHLICAETIVSVVTIGTTCVSTGLSKTAL